MPWPIQTIRTILTVADWDKRHATSYQRPFLLLFWATLIDRNVSQWNSKPNGEELHWQAFLSAGVPATAKKSLLKLLVCCTYVHLQTSEYKGPVTTIMKKFKKVADCQESCSLQTVSGFQNNCRFLKTVTGVSVKGHGEQKGPQGQWYIIFHNTIIKISDT